ncbi:MAG: hypothetical protein SA339_13705 [Methanomassiliicoccus sp.]|nr:hypothetical protein [Methanomassiliicoccus sp.]
MIEIALITFLYAFLGGSIKFIDQAYDEKAFSVRAANVVAVMSGLVMGYLMAVDSPFSTAFYSAMLISLVMARKIDNRAFALGTVLAVASLLAFYPSSNVQWALWPIMAFLVAGFVDEVADGMVDKYGIQGGLQMFLNYRPFSDIALFVMILAGAFSWLYLLPYFGFTFSYLLVERYSEKELSFTNGVVWIKQRVLRRVN